MKKILKFRKGLAYLILQGEKDTMWRLFDDKDITMGDVCKLLVWETLELFANRDCNCRARSYVCGIAPGGLGWS